MERKQFNELAEGLEWLHDNIVEGKMGQIHADISQHLDKHIADYKAHGGAEHLGAKTVKVAGKIAKLHGIEHKHAQKFVNDYVDSKLNEQTDLDEAFDTPYFNQHIAAHKGKNYGEIAKHYGADKTKEHITNLTKERDALMAKHRTIKAGMFHDQAIRGLKAGLKHINESADPSSYMQQAAKARTRGELHKASIYTRMAAAARRGDEATIRELQGNLSNVREACEMSLRLKAKAIAKKKAESK